VTWRPSRNAQTPVISELWEQVSQIRPTKFTVSENDSIQRQHSAHTHFLLEQRSEHTPCQRFMPTTLKASEAAQSYEDLDVRGSNLEAGYT
jgi:hypothetical protein